MDNLERTVDHLHRSAEQSNSFARMDTIKYTTAIQALARNNKVHIAHRYLQEMASEYKGGSQACKPDVKIFHAVLSAWARYPQAGVATDKAEALIARLWELSKKEARLKPTVFAYNCLLICCKNAKSPRRAHSLLEEMKDFAEANLIDAPTATSYSAVLDAWDRSKDPCKAFKIRLLKGECTDRFGSVPTSSTNW